MSLAATVVDPLTGSDPPGWDAFVEAHQLLPGWHSGPLRAIAWCIPLVSSMVTVTESGAAAPQALFYARHIGPASPLRLGRFRSPGRPPRVNLVECRTAPVPQQAGFAFAPELGLRDRIEAVRGFERVLRRRTGAIGILYRSLSARELPLVESGARLRRPGSPLLVLENRWPDLAGYLASLPRKWRWQLRKLRRVIGADPDLRVAFEDAVDPVEAAWLAEVIRLRYTPRRPPRPPLGAYAIAQLGRLPGSRFLTYRDAAGRLLACSALYDNGTDLVLIWWGSRDYADGRRRDLYFDQYVRVAELMIALGRRRLQLGFGMAEVKIRFGARPEPRWRVSGAIGTGPR